MWDVWYRARGDAEWSLAQKDFGSEAEAQNWVVVRFGRTLNLFDFDYRFREG